MPSAHVVSFSPCKDKTCAYNQERQKHLLIGRAIVPVEKRAATAISYAWGEFNRQQRFIGHYEDGTPASIELGEEWNLDHLFDTLSSKRMAAAHCTEPYLWMDQLCIAQDDPEEVRKTLAQIPDIYATFGVAILIPGQACECFPLWLNQLDTGASGPAEVMLNGRSFTVAQNSCYNLLGLCGWATRIWTRQEMVYARSMRLVWTDESLAACPTQCKGLPVRETNAACIGVPVPELAQVLSPTAILWFRKISAEKDASSLNSLDVSQIFSVGDREMEPTRRQQLGLLKTTVSNALEDVSKQLTLTCTMILTELKNATIAWMIHHMGPLAAELKLDPRVLIFELLRGLNFDYDDFRRPHGLPEKPHLSKIEHVFEFLKQLGRLQTTRRFANKPRDYVLSVWVDCPRYIVPKRHHDMSALELLYDACEQLYQNYGLNVGTHFPRDLFGDGEEGSELFRLYSRTAKQEALTNCYGHIAVFPTYPDCINRKRELFLSHKTQDMGDWVFSKPTIIPAAGRSSSDISALAESLRIPPAALLVQLILAFTPPHQLRLIHYLQGNHGAPHSAPSHVFLDRLSRSRELTQLQTQQVGVWDPSSFRDLAVPEVFSHSERQSPAFPRLLQDVAFDLACLTLGFDFRAARNVGFCVVVRTSPLMLGLAREWRGEGGKTCTEAYRPVEFKDDLDPTLIYEVQQTGERGGGESSEQEGWGGRRVVGVWVPVRLEIIKEQYSQVTPSPYEEYNADKVFRLLKSITA